MQYFPNFLFVSYLLILLLRKNSCADTGAPGVCNSLIVAMRKISVAVQQCTRRDLSDNRDSDMSGSIFGRRWWSDDQIELQEIELQV